MTTTEFPLLQIEEERWLLRNYSREFLKQKSYEELRHLLPYPERSFGHLMAAFVSEICSISFQGVDGDDEKTFDVYGTIGLLDGEGAFFSLYDRSQQNAEAIRNGGFLSITPPSDRAITGTGLVELRIDLKDNREGGVQIIKDVFPWDFTLNKHDEIKQKKTFHSEGGSVSVDFMSYRHAVVCNVQVKVLTDFNGGNVYGKIFSNAADKISTILFENQRINSVSLTAGNNIQLSRYVVIAPARSPSLKIHVNFFDGDNNERIIDDIFQFGIWASQGVRNIKGHSGLIEVRVRWDHPSAQLHLFPEVTPTVPGVVDRYSMFSIGSKLLEIYSISVFGNVAEGSSIWGSIKLSIPGQDEVTLFKEDKIAPRELLPGSKVPLLSCTEEWISAAFCLSVELNDPADRSISNGLISWDERSFANYKAFLDCQLCSIVRSVNGSYVAVHYSCFQAGTQVVVKLYLNDKNLDLKYFNVNGSVFTEYSEYDYSTAYQKEYYRKKIFMRESNEPVLPYPFFGLLLAESSVVVPEDCALMLDIRLQVTSSETLPTLGVGGNIPGDVSLEAPEQVSFENYVEFSMKDVDFQSGKPKMVFRKFEESSLQLLIQVEWKKVIKNALL